MAEVSAPVRNGLSGKKRVEEVVSCGIAAIVCILSVLWIRIRDGKWHWGMDGCWLCLVCLMFVCLFVCLFGGMAGRGGLRVEVV